VRDLKRIKILLDEIENVWKQYPDLRLMQLLLNAVGTNDNVDHYNTEDDYLLDQLRILYGGN
jgi:uncharacterized protein YihD (DUF1040 family)